MKVKGIIILLFFSLSLTGCETDSSYTITWNNDDGTTLEVDKNVIYGSMPTYDGVTPTKDDNEEGYYTLSGWSPSISKVTGNKTYVAQYSFYAYDDFLNYTLNDDETSYSVELKADASPIKLKIADVHLGKPVISIPNKAFEQCFSLTSIIIPDSVKNMGAFIFHNCISLISIIMPANISSIEMSTFFNCSSLTSIVIPSSVTSIGMDAFFNCSSLTSIFIPSSITYLGDSIFSGCLSLVAIDVDNNNSNYSSDNGILYNKDKTTLICYPGGKIETSFALPSSVTSIGDSAFYFCFSLISITLPSSVTSIGNYAFYRCVSLSTITLPNSVVTIGLYAFSGCSSLISINIPDSVTSIGNSAFVICPSLTAIDVDNNNANYSSDNGILFNKDKTTLICYPGGKTETSFVILNSISSIASCAFDSCSFLTSIIIPNSVISMGNSVFFLCDNLTIYVEAESKPAGWSDYWNSYNCPVVWGYRA